MQGSTRIDELRQKFHENPRRYFAPLANEYRKAGDPEQAIAICRAHLAQQPGHMSGHVVYGQALFDAKRSEEARVVFEKALSLDPDNAIVLKQLGDIAREKGDTSEARHWYSRAIDVDPNDRETAAYIAELAEPLTEESAVEEPVAAEVVAEEQVVVAEPVASESVAEERVAELETPEAEVPEAAPEPESEQPIPVTTEADVSWRKTPQHEESPFVTRTMAELYASQGYRQAALDVYRQLALQHPDDKEIVDRIEMLERDEPRESGSTPEVTPFDPVISDMPVDSPAESFRELTDESVFAPSSEDMNLDFPGTGADKPEQHFTEQELSTGDSWDTDSWAAGFASDEDLNLDFDSPDIPVAELPRDDTPSPRADVDAPPESVPESPAEAEIQLDDAGAQPAEEIPPVREPEPEQEPEPEAVREDARSAPPPPG